MAAVSAPAGVVETAVKGTAANPFPETHAPAKPTAHVAERESHLPIPPAVELAPASSSAANPFPQPEKKTPEKAPAASAGNADKSHATAAKHGDFSGVGGGSDHASHSDHAHGAHDTHGAPHDPTHKVDEVLHLPLLPRPATTSGFALRVL
jgi:hypothetical protein